MNESYISKPILIAVVLWAAVAVFMASGWLAFFLSEGRLAVMLAATGCAASAAATVAHLRFYTMRVGALIRNVGLDAPSPTPTNGNGVRRISQNAF